MQLKLINIQQRNIGIASDYLQVSKSMDNACYYTMQLDSKFENLNALLGLSSLSSKHN